MTENIEMEHKLYKRRWAILLLFMLYAVNGAAQWLQFAIISNLVMKYYNGITPTDIEWTTTCPMLIYVILIFPSLHMLDKVGLRNTMIIAAAGITIGTWIKLLSVHPDRFYLVLVGTLIQAIFTVLTFGLSARFTAVWFGADEISIAGALGLFGDQLGTALSFFIPSSFVSDGPPEVIGNGLRRMHWYHSGVSTVILSMIVLFFKSAPKLPPSAAQAKQRQSEKINVFQVIKTIMKKRAFVFIFFSYGLHLALLNAFSALLNRTVLVNFPDHTTDAGNIGFVFMLSGMFCSLFVGKILDKTRKFKESAVMLTMGSAASLIAFTWALKSLNIINVYIAAFFIGCFAQSYYGTGFQMGIEVTFPVSEEISSATLLLSAQIHSFFITTLYGYAIEKFGDLPSNIGLVVGSSITVLYSLLIPSNLKRQEAEKSVHDEASKIDHESLMTSKTSK